MEFTQLPQAEAEAESQHEPQRGRHTPTQRKKYLIKKWEASNQTQVSFCKQNKINIKTFASWIKIFKSNLPEITSTIENSTNLKSLLIEIRLPNGAEFCVKHATETALTLIIREALACKYN